MKYSYGSYISNYKSFDTLVYEFDSIVDSFFNENDTFSALLEEENKQSLIQTIKEKFNKLVKFVKETLIPKIKEILSKVKGKLISLGDSIDNLLKSGKLILNRDINMARSDVAVKQLTEYSRIIIEFTNANDLDKFGELKEKVAAINDLFKDQKNRYIAKAGDKVDVIELNKIKNNRSKIQAAQDNINKNLTAQENKLFQLEREAMANDAKAKEAYNTASFMVSILRSATKSISKYIVDGNILVNAVEERKNTENAKKETTQNKK